MPRLFIGCRIPETRALRILTERIQSLDRRLRLEPAVNRHVTLKFLGEVEESRLASLVREMDAQLTGEPSFEIRLRGLSAFPSPGRPSVVWVGFEPPLEPLGNLADRLQSGFEPLGFPKEERPYVPHVTLVRLHARVPQGLQELFDQHAESDFGRIAIDSIELYESQRARDGVRYLVRSRRLLEPAR